MATTKALKVFKLDHGLAPRTALGLAGAPAHVQQGDVFVSARTKVAAMQYAHAAGLSAQASHWSTAAGNDLDYMREAGVLTTSGDTVVITSSSIPTAIVRFDRNLREWTVIGKFVRRTVAFDTPGAHFGQHVHVELVPPPQPRRVVIELDADTPDDVVTSLTGLVRVADLCGNAFAFGKVVSEVPR